MECDIPELVVFLQEDGDNNNNNNEIYKDISIDRGGGDVQSHHTSPVQYHKLDNDISYKMKYELNKDIRSKASSEKALFIMKKPESFPEQDCVMDLTKHYKSDNSVKDKLDGGTRVEFVDTPFESKQEKQIQDHDKEAKIKKLESECTGDDLGSPNRLISLRQIFKNAECDKPYNEVEERNKVGLLKNIPEVEEKERVRVSSPGSRLIPLDSSSFRSTSSTTTSGRSFAFPILSSECTGSPVRMAEADNAHLKRHKRWKSCFCL